MEALEIEQLMILRHWEEVIIDYKAFIRFRRGLERSRVALYQYRYYIALAYFKAMYLRMELEEDSFID